MENKRIALAMGIAAIALLAAGNASALSASARNSDMWLGDKTTIICDFNGSSPSEAVYASVTSPIVSKLTQFAAIAGGLYTLEYTPPVAGRYIILCMGQPDAKAEFRVSDLQLRIDSMQNIVYADGFIDLSLELKRGENNESVIDNATFRAVLAGKELALKPPYFYNNLWHLSSSEPASSIGIGNHTLEVLASVREKTVRQKSFINIKPIIEFNISSTTQEISSSDALSLRLYATDHGASLIGSIPVTISLGGTQVSYDISGNEVTIRPPKMPPGKYNVRAETQYNGMSFADEKEILYSLLVQGDDVSPLLQNAEGKIIFLNSETERQILISKGRYRGLVPRGTYTATVQLGSLKATYSNARIENDYAELVRFDSFSSSAIEGLSPVAGAAIEFSAPFEKGTAELTYDAEKSTNESSISVQKCSEWNLDSRLCSGSWQKAESTTDTIRNIVKLSIPEKIAIIAGERGRLSLEAKSDGQGYFTGEKVEITGIVRDGDKPVADAAVTVKLGGDEITVNTDQIGVFKASLRALDAEGSQTAYIWAAKGNFMPAEVSVSWTAQKRKSLALVLPQAADVEAGGSVSLELGVLNNGQASLDNLQVKVEGLPEGWISYSPKGRASIGKGEEMKIRADIIAQKPDRAAYNIMVTASAGSVDISDSFVLLIRNRTASFATVPEVKEENSILTGLAAAAVQYSDAAVVIAIGIMAILIMREWRSRRAPADDKSKSGFEDAMGLRSRLLGDGTEKGARKKGKRLIRGDR